MRWAETVSNARDGPSHPERTPHPTLPHGPSLPRQEETGRAAGGGTDEQDVTHYDVSAFDDELKEFLAVASAQVAS